MLNGKQTISVAVSCLIFLGALKAEVKTQVGLFQHTSLDNALVMAAEQNRVVFVDFYTAWCGACKKLDEDTWTDKKVIEILKKKTIPLEIDADRESAIREKYNLKAYPTLLILAADGSILNRFEGYMLPAQFIATLQRVLAERNTHARARINGTGAIQKGPVE
jgi:thiol:disulfide interchange protein